tara:strand:- start:1519 stop:1827 length:309 start_codon:yes stop_codon:yes gene_type:complete
MKTTNNKQQTTNIKFIFEYNRDADKQTPHKINKTKELFSLLAEYSFLTIGFSCGKNTNKDTICNFDTYIKEGVNMKDLLYKLFIIWDEYIYIEQNELKRFAD